MSTGIVIGFAAQILVGKMINGYVLARFTLFLGIVYAVAIEHLLEIEIYDLCYLSGYYVL